MSCTSNYSYRIYDRMPQLGALSSREPWGILSELRESLQLFRAGDSIRDAPTLFGLNSCSLPPQHYWGEGEGAFFWVLIPCSYGNGYDAFW